MFARALLGAQKLVFSKVNYQLIASKNLSLVASRLIFKQPVGHTFGLKSSFDTVNCSKSIISFQGRFSSTMKKRVIKMNKHKYRKRIKLMKMNTKKSRN
jgi:hypothetical protein